ncbi:MAG TPA: mercuric reductase [Gemmatimonadota bacterium]|nr:mercuric reductase [Gemmatimonadota bacterium]
MTAPAPIDPHERRRLERVRPPGWTNPTPADRYNLVVLGAGTAGLVTAAGAAGLGARVALVERGLMGGDCLNTGCVPSKALLASARAVADARAAGGLGVRIPDVSADFAAALGRMRRLRADLAAHDSAARFRALGVDVFLGEGRFVARDAVEVEGVRLRFARAVIATGARPVVPPVPGLADAGFLTSESVWDLAALPPRLAVVGGGPLGCELAQAFARFGSRVTVVEVEDRVLPAEDADAAAIVAAALGADGVDLALGSRLARVARTAGECRLTLESRADPRDLEVDAILVAVGRAPEIGGLDPAAAGVRLDGRRAPIVDDRLRTSNRRIYAAGDAAGGQQFTHVADAHARLVIRNALFPGSAKASALTLPWCTYTDPEVAGVGLDRAAAAAAGREVRAFEEPWDAVDRAVLDGETAGFARVLVDAEGDEILGATIVGRHAGEAISLVTLAMEKGIGLTDLAAVVHPYPTRMRALGAIADQYQRTRLGPRARSLLDRWMRWRRR